MVRAARKNIRILTVACLVCGAVTLPSAGCGNRDATAPVLAATRTQTPAAVAQLPIPEPPSWSFPDVIESARLLAPRNVEGRPFDQHGLAYAPEALDALPVATMSALELQRYADIVTHAYPDAVFRQVPASCQDPALDHMNATAMAGIAYVSLHAIDPATRKRAATCLAEVQERRLAQSPAEEWVNKAGVKLKRGDVKGAISDLERAIRLDPNYYWAYISRGSARSLSGDLQGTIADTDRAIELDPSHYSSYNLRAFARQRLKDYKGAIEDYNKVIELKPPQEFLFLTYFSRGDARRLAGDLEGAIDDCTKSIELYPSGEAYDNRGMAYADQGNFDLAIADYQKAAEIFKARGDLNNYESVIQRLRLIEARKRRTNP